MTEECDPYDDIVKKALERGHYNTTKAILYLLAEIIRNQQILRKKLVV